MKSKKLIIILTILLLILSGVLVYLVFIKENNKDTNTNNKNSEAENIGENKEEEKKEEKEEEKEENVEETEEAEEPKQEVSLDITDKIKSEDDYFLTFKINSNIEELYDKYKNTDFSFKTSIKGKDISGDLEDVEVKIENGVVVYKENDKIINIESITNPVSIRLNFDVSDENDAKTLYVLNDAKELYKVEVNSSKVFVVEKIEENVDSFNYLDGNNLPLTYSEGQNLILITKSGNNIKLNGVSIDNYTSVNLTENIIISKKSDSFVKYNDNDLEVKGIFITEKFIYIITEDNEVIINDEDKYNKVISKFKNLEVIDNKVTIHYESSDEVITLVNYYTHYYDGKLYQFEENI